MTHAREKGKSARRMKEFVEIVSVDAKTDEVKTNVLFMWDPMTDTYQKVNESVILRKLVEAKGENFEDALAEIERRKKVLFWLHSQDIKDYVKVSEYVNMYYKEPAKVFEQMKEEYCVKIKPETSLPVQIPSAIPMETPIQMEQKNEINEERVEIPVEQPGRVSMLGLLGLKMNEKK